MVDTFQYKGRPCSPRATKSNNAWKLPELLQDPDASSLINSRNIPKTKAKICQELYNQSQDDHKNHNDKPAKKPEKIQAKANDVLADIKSKTVVVLRGLLKEAHLKTGGNKPDLVERYHQYLVNQLDVNDDNEKTNDIYINEEGDIFQLHQCRVYTIKQLKFAMKQLSLSITGTKDTLCSRLEKYYNQHPDNDQVVEKKEEQHVDNQEEKEVLHVAPVAIPILPGVPHQPNNGNLMMQKCQGWDNCPKGYSRKSLVELALECGIAVKNKSKNIPMAGICASLSEKYGTKPAENNVNQNAKNAKNAKKSKKSKKSKKDKQITKLDSGKYRISSYKKIASKYWNYIKYNILYPDTKTGYLTLPKDYGIIFLKSTHKPQSFLLFNLISYEIYYIIYSTSGEDFPILLNLLYDHYHHLHPDQTTHQFYASTKEMIDNDVNMLKKYGYTLDGNRLVRDFSWGPFNRNNCKNPETLIFQEPMSDVPDDKFIVLHNNYCFNIDELIQSLISTDDANINPADPSRNTKIWIDDTDKALILSHPGIDPLIKQDYDRMINQKRIKEEQILDQIANDLIGINKLGSIGFELLNDNLSSHSHDPDVFKDSAKVLLTFRDFINASPHKYFYENMSVGPLRLGTVLDTAHNECIHGVGVKLMAIYITWYVKLKFRNPQLPLSQYYFVLPEIPSMYHSVGISYSGNSTKINTLYLKSFSAEDANAENYATLVVHSANNLSVQPYFKYNTQILNAFIKHRFDIYKQYNNLTHAK